MTIAKRITAAASVAVAAMALLVGCGSSADDASESGALRLGLPAAPPSLDPATITEGQMILFMQSVYDSLLVVSPDGKIEPNLATSWEYDEPQTSLTLKLRSGVTFTDGEVLDAEAVVTGLEHLRKGAGTGTQQLLSVKAVTAVDEATVRLDLAQRDPALLYSLGTYGGFIASPKAIAAGDLAAAPVGSGPYELSSADTVAGSTYVFDRNDDYWNEAAFDFDRVEAKVMDTPAAMLNALKSGQIDGMYGAAELVGDAKSNGLSVHVGTPSTWSGYFLNDRDGRQVPELGDVRVRQAINHAIDREGIVETFYKDAGIPVEQVFNPASSAWSDELNDRYPYDPDRAEELLGEAGATGFTLPIVSFPRLLDRLEPIIEQQLGDVGIEVKWVKVAPADYGKGLLGAPVYPMIMSTNVSPWTDLRNVAMPTAIMNGMQSQTPELDALLKNVAEATDDGALAAAYQGVNEYLVDEAWFAPIVALNGIYFTSDAVTVVMPDAQVVPSLRDFASTD